MNVAERVEAILAVGYREAPAADPHLARSGTQFAERLAVALSKSARDERPVPPGALRSSHGAAESHFVS